MPTIARRLSPLLIVMLVTSCAGFLQSHDQTTLNTIKDELAVGAETKPTKTAAPIEINDALLPPLKIEIPKINPTTNPETIGLCKLSVPLNCSIPAIPAHIPTKIACNNI